MTNNLRQIEGTWQRFGSMINTALIVVSACAFVYAWGQYDAGIKYDIARLEATVIRNAEDVNAYIAQHESLIKERFGANRALAAEVDTRIKATEKTIEDVLRKADRVEYRITVAESSIAQQTSIQQANAEKLNNLTADVRVIKEVVVRRDVSTRSKPNKEDPS